MALESEFLTAAAHILKGPAHASAAYTRHLVSQHPELAEEVGPLADTLERLADTSQAILQYVKVDRPATVVRPVNLIELGQEVWADLGPPEGATLEMASNLPRLRADPALLYFVLQTLICNSLKYNDTTHKQIYLSYNIQNKRHIYIQDNGRGIEPPRVATIFDVLSGRIDNGAGLGLATARKIVRQVYGGDLFVADTLPGHGTTFCFYLGEEFYE